MKPLKSKGVAYFLLLFFGVLGGHKFYMDKVFMGILYLLTAGFFGIGVIVDLFLLSGQVDRYNAEASYDNMRNFGGRY